MKFSAALATCDKQNARGGERNCCFLSDRNKPVIKRNAIGVLLKAETITTLRIEVRRALWRADATVKLECVCVCLFSVQTSWVDTRKTHWGVLAKLNEITGDRRRSCTTAGNDLYIRPERTSRYILDAQ